MYFVQVYDVRCISYIGIINKSVSFIFFVFIFYCDQKAYVGES